MKTIHIVSLCLIALISAISCSTETKQGESSIKNLAIVATTSSSSGFRSASSFKALNDGIIPVESEINREKAYIGWSRDTVHYVQYDWIKPVKTKEIALSWWDNQDRIRLPKAIRLLYWDGSNFIQVSNISDYEILTGKLSSLGFDEIETTKMRLEMHSKERSATGILEWIVYASDKSIDYPPVVKSGVDRNVILGGKTYLSGIVKSITPLQSTLWSKDSGPGTVKFYNSEELETTAIFSEPGDYVLSLSANTGKNNYSSSLKVTVRNPPPEKRLDIVYTRHYKIDNPLWNNRARAMIVNWIPHTIEQINRTDLEKGQGGIDNFIEAAKALRGEPHGKHLGYVFSNAWVYQTIEAMSIALMIDPQGDKQIIAAQKKMTATLEDWIPKILAAQEPDGYIQTAYTLRDTSRWKNRWAPENRSTHEGYVGGYFIESAINHYTLTNGNDIRLYDAAKKMADCWVNNIGPDKLEWFDGHQEMEQALVRFGRFVNDMEVGGQGDSYIDLSKFLLDSRGGGGEYDQSHLPVQKQYEAVGHAVRAVYSYSGMADIAAETGDVDYQSAVISLWDNIVNKKYYVTGGIGSGQTSEGFGPDYSLRNNAYCESCSSCGMIFFQYKMNIAYHDAKYADLYEETMYNALMGSLDLEGRNFFYTNPLTSSQSRDPWHVCPCCVGNIPRTMLMIPTWTYVKSNDGIYVNLFIGSTITVENVAGTDVELVQKTEYPWKGDVAIIVNPEHSREFTINVRVPDRKTSSLYESVPQVSGLLSLSVNGENYELRVNNGYMPIKRIWEKGDKIEFVIPMKIQRITADERIEANNGMLALRYGPLIYSVEDADQSNIDQALGTEALSLEWREDLLGGVMTIKGTWADGTPFMAIPNYARNNRNINKEDGNSGRSTVWIKNQ